MNVNNSYKFVKTLENQRDEIEQIHKEKRSTREKGTYEYLGGKCICSQKVLQ